MAKLLSNSFICFCILLGISHKTIAQQVLRGVVTNSQKVPVSNVSIKLKEFANALPISFTISNNNGGYTLKIPLKGKKYLVESSLIGYRSATFEFTTSSTDTPGTVIQKDILLIPDTATLPSIDVYSIPPITVSGDTTTFRASAFKKGNEINVGDLLTGMPGFSVTNGRITYDGKSISKVLIEDDDLFGNDYTTVIQNLSPKGIEKIQLIENYNDKTYLSNRVQKGTELVVNVKYEKKYLYKVIASNEAGISISPPTDYYKIRQNIVSLIPRLKFVTTTNFNNTGLLATELLGSSFSLPSEYSMFRRDGINFDLVPKFSSGPVELLPDIYSAIVPKNKMIANHTSLITGNGMYRPSKKIMLKNIIQWYRDAFDQRQLQTIDYSVSGTNLIVSNRQVLHKQIPLVNASIESAYSPSVSTQFVYKATFSSLGENDSLQESRQTRDIFTTYQNRSKIFQQQLGFSFSPDSARIIDFRIMHKSDFSEQQPLIYPSNIYAALTFDSTAGSVRSSVHTGNTEYAFQGKVVTTWKKSNWSLEILHTISNTHFHSGIALIRKDSMQEIGAAQFINNAQLTTHISSLIISYNSLISKNIYLRTTHRFEAGNQDFINRNRTNPGISYMRYLPAYSLRFSLSKTKNLDLSFDYKSKLSGIHNFSNGYIFATENTIIVGDSNLQSAISKTVSLAYSYHELAKNKLSWVLIGSYSREPVLYLSNPIPGDFYTLTNRLPFNKDGVVFFLTSTLTKYISSIKSQLSIELQFNTTKNYYSNKNQAGTLAFAYLLPKIKIKTLLTNRITTNFSANATLVSQVFDKGSIKERKNTSQTFTYNTEFVYRPGNSWIINAGLQYNALYQGSRKFSLYSGELGIKYIAIKDRLHFMLSGNNLFNNQSFTSVTLLPYSINTQNIDLIRPYLMLHATFEL